ncbi:MAG: baseplate J/gp47 family protein [Gloeotrichia echinulata IR180]
MQDKLNLPYSSDRQPTPSLALIEQVETYIRSRCEATIDLVVTAPKWQKITVTATITPVSLENADIVRNNVRQRLEAFLHPLTGGNSQD